MADQNSDILLNLNPPGMTADEVARRGRSDAKVDIPDAERTDDPSLLPKPGGGLGNETLAEGGVQDYEFQVEDSTVSVGESGREVQQVIATTVQADESSSFDQGVAQFSVGPTGSRTGGTRDRSGSNAADTEEVNTTEPPADQVSEEAVATPAVTPAVAPIVTGTFAGPSNTPPVLVVTLINSFIEDAPGNQVGSLVAIYTVSDAQGNPVTVTLSDTTNYALDGNGSVTLTAAGLALVNNGEDLPAFTLTPNDGAINSAAVLVDPSVTELNDAATVSSAVVTLEETDAPLTTSGTLTVSDVDNEEAFTANTIVGDKGTFTIDADCNWTFTAKSVFNELNVGESVSETFTVATVDGTTSTVQITINGTNDAAVATFTTAQAVNEDGAVIGGQLTATDVDTLSSRLTYSLVGQAIPGLIINPNGSWSFNPGDAAYQSLSAGARQVLVVTYQVRRSWRC